MVRLSVIRRCFGRDQTVFDPWHYVPVLARKPGALRNGAPFKNWILPGGIERVRRKLAGVADGDCQMVSILTTVLSDGLPAVEAACSEALREGAHSADVIINILARRREPEPPITITTRTRCGCGMCPRLIARDATASGVH